MDGDRQAFTRALIAAGAAMTQPGQGGFAAALGRGGLFGMQAYDNAIENMQQQQMREQVLRRQQLEEKLQEIALQKQQALAAIFSGSQAPSGNSGPSVADSPSWASNPLNVPKEQGGQEDLIRKLASSGYTKEAKDQLDIFKGLEGEVYGSIEKDVDGKPFVMTKRGPKYLRGGFVPRDKIVSTDLGDGVGLRGEYDTSFKAIVPKGQSPDSKASLAQSQRHFEANYFKPQIYDAGSGQPPVMWAPDGKGGISTAPSGLPTKPERLPSGDAEKILSLDELVAKAKVARAEVEKNPDAVGPSNAVIPSFMLNMGNAANVTTRAKLSELSTSILLARSGAAVTEHEYKRLEPFLATPNDTPGSAKTKLKNLIDTMSEIAQNRRRFYGTQGYNVPKAVEDTPLPENMSTEDLKAAVIMELSRRRGK